MKITGAFGADGVDSSFTKLKKVGGNICISNGSPPFSALKTVPGVDTALVVRLSPRISLWHSVAAAWGAEVSE